MLHEAVFYPSIIKASSLHSIHFKTVPYTGSHDQSNAVHTNWGRGRKIVNPTVILKVNTTITFFGLKSSVI